MNDDARDEPMPDELKVDVDREKLAKWDDVSTEYAGEGEEDKKRPVFADDDTSTSERASTSDDD